MNELQAHIEAQNAKHREMAGEGALVFTVVSDPEHWAGYGITTVEQYERYMAIETFVDIYKDINGIKPRWMNFDEMSLEEIEADIDRMCEQAREEDELMDYQMEVWMMEEEQEHEEDRADAELAPTKYELMAEQAGY